ncbi:Probable lysophospholipase BODYGUARD 3 [Linum perenne]
MIKKIHLTVHHIFSISLPKSMGKMKEALNLTGGIVHDAVSFAVFLCLDLLDFVLCFAYKLLDFMIEAEWKPCYCTTKEAITSSGKILLSEHGHSRIVSLTSTKLELEEISQTLYSRPSLVSQVSNFTVNEVLRIRSFKAEKEKSMVLHCSQTVRSRFTVQTIQGKRLRGLPRWSDCDCKFCTNWTTHGPEDLFVKVQRPKDHEEAKEDVVFIHGFISSSALWTETLFPNFSEEAKSRYRMFAVDLLGFGRSPKPTDSLYTLKEHLEMIEKSVIEPYKVKSFHIVAHSLGCILALALAVKHPGSVKSLTLIAPPYFPVPKGVEEATQYVMRKLAPRKVWPPIALGASMCCWYEHITRTICLVICKNHRLWEFLTKLVTRNRIRTFLLEGFFCHTHNAAWHTLHNIICGTGSKLDGYFDQLRDHLSCHVNVFHGSHDALIPVECSFNVQRRVPRARVKVFHNKDHITIIVGQQKAFAMELEEIWTKSSES